MSSPRFAHRVRRMQGRDPHENARAATPLELLFDLVFVIGFGTAADEFTHSLTTEHIGVGLIGFTIATFGISWAWINFSWFASAYDTDDWIYRLTTMVQMVGVVVLSLGIPDLFESLVDGEHIATQVVVLGYVVMRGPMVFQWLRAARQDPERSALCRTMAFSLAAVQVGWVALALIDPATSAMLPLIGLLIAVEVAVPLAAERRFGGTPWHAHHIAERYGLLVIIALGEGLIGTTVALGSIVGPEGPGWTLDAAVLGVAGVALPFGMWWIYFAVPHGEVLHRRRERSFGWGYGHMAVFGSVVAVGAGLHAAAYRLDHHSELGEVATVLSVAIPVLVFLLAVIALYDALTRSTDVFHVVIVVGAVALIGVGVALSVAGAGLVWSLVPVAFAPWISVIGYEWFDHRKNAEVLASL